MKAAFVNPVDDILRNLNMLHCGWRLVVTSVAFAAAFPAVLGQTTASIMPFGQNLTGDVSENAISQSL